MSTRGPRRFVVSVVLSAEEDRRLRDAAEERGVSVSNLGRRLMRLASQNFSDFSNVDRVEPIVRPRGLSKEERERRYAAAERGRTETPGQANETEIVEC